MGLIEVTIGSIGLILFFSLFLFNTKLKDKQEVMTAHPVNVIVVAPLLEEFIFRLLPVLLLGPSWEIGILASIFFGLLHSAKIYGSTFTINFKDIHWIPATIAGLWLWYVMTEYGFWLAVYSHFLNNLVTFYWVKLTTAKRSYLS